MIDRRKFIGSVVGGILATSRTGNAQQAGKVYRIGYSAPSRASVELVLQAFLRALRDLGWVEGQNLLIEYRWADGKIERLPDLALELAQQEVDLIVAPAGIAAQAAKQATSSIPIVMMFAVDPVALGLVASLGRPGGNVTGTALSPGSAIFGKQLQILKEAVGASRVAILANPADAGLASQVQEVETAAAVAGHPPATRGSTRSRGTRWRLRRHGARTDSRRFCLSVPRRSWCTGPGSPSSR